MIIYLILYLLGMSLFYILLSLIFYFLKKGEYISIMDTESILYSLKKDYNSAIWITAIVIYPIPSLVFIIYALFLIISSIPDIIINQILYFINFKNNKILETKIALLQVGDDIGYTYDNNDLYERKILEVKKNDIIIQNSSGSKKIHKSKIKLYCDKLVIVDLI